MDKSIGLGSNTGFWATGGLGFTSGLGFTAGFAGIWGFPPLSKSTFSSGFAALPDLEGLCAFASLSEVSEDSQILAPSSLLSDSAQQSFEISRRVDSLGPPERISTSASLDSTKRLDPGSSVSPIKGSVAMETGSISPIGGFVALEAA